MKVGFQKGFAEEKTKKSVCNEDSSSSFSSYKKLDFSKSSPEGRDDRECVLLLSLVLGFLNVFREFGMISE